MGLHPDLSIILKPATLLGLRQIKSVANGDDELDVLIQWEGASPEDATWESGQVFVD